LFCKYRNRCGRLRDWCGFKRTTNSWRSLFTCGRSDEQEIDLVWPYVTISVFFFQNLFRYFISKGGCLIGPQVIKFSIFGRFTLLCLPPTPLKLLNRISWNLVDSKDTISSCAYYQEILIAWILWELCPFQLRNFPKYTSEAACQCNSSETTKQNFMKLGR
jgi:hypothetical protein